MPLSELYNTVRDSILDSSEVVKEVNRYREYWKPRKQLNVVLLAESHGHTTKAEFVARWRFGDLSGRWVKFVFCLGNGERNLFGKGHAAKSNVGTTQYWKLLYSCVNEVKTSEDFGPIIPSHTRDYRVRVRNKIALLRRLQNCGIWLVDACPVAINILNGETKKRLIQEAWLDYAKPLLRNAKELIVVGFGVEKALSSQLGKLEIPYRVIPQP